MNFADRLTVFNKVLSDTECSNKLNKKTDLNDGLEAITSKLQLLRDNSSHVYIIGNGGSSSIASHMMIDLLNMAKIKSHTINDPSSLTCLSNDYGYENVFSKSLDIHLSPKDVLIAISSSGESLNIINAMEIAKSKENVFTITLTGFEHDNHLRKMGDINLWLNSKDYGIVENAHAFLLHYITDKLAI